MRWTPSHETRSTDCARALSCFDRMLVRGCLPLDSGLRCPSEQHELARATRQACPYVGILLSCIAVKSTFDINDALLARAKRAARKAGKPLRALVEDGLRRVLDDTQVSARYELPDRAVGRVGAPNPLEQLSWQDLRDEIYGGR